MTQHDRVDAGTFERHDTSMYKAVLTFFFYLSGCSSSQAATLNTSFDFSQSLLGLEVSLRGQTFYAILDTGVDPSVVNLADADALGLKIDKTDSGEASGFGEGRGMTVFPTRIEGMSILGHRFPDFDALATDTASFTGSDQRQINVVLGYSFLSDKIVLIDYIAHKLAILDDSANAQAMVRACRTRWWTPLKTFDSFPVIPRFRLGNANGPVTLDTGSSGGIALFQDSLNLPGIAGFLVDQGTSTRRGARGQSKVETFILSQPVGFGPFTLTAGQDVFVHKQPGPAISRIANIGNTVLAAFKIKMLLDYRSGSMTFYGDCH